MIDGIAIHRHFIIADKDGDGVFLHPADEPFTVIYKYPGVEWKVFHDVVLKLKDKEPTVSNLTFITKLQKWIKIECFSGKSECFQRL
jgi:hypothetical protein